MRLQNPDWLFAIVPLAILIIIIVKSRLIKIKDKAVSAEYEELRAKRRPVSYLIIGSRIIIITFLLLALASPYIIKQTVVSGEQPVTILVDRSNSFQVFDQNMGASVKSILEQHFPVELRDMGSGETSALGDDLFANLRGNDNIILVTDGHVNTGQDLNDVVLYGTSLNSTIHAMKLRPIDNDVSVRVIGPSKTVAEVDNKFLVEIDNPANEVIHLTVTVDGKTVISRDTFETSHSFSHLFGIGTHEVVAEVTTNDRFPQNNKYYKTVEVVKKPAVLFVSIKTSPLAKILDELYNVEQVNAVPNDLSKYSAVILNDIFNMQDMQIRTLSNFVIDGNGLFVIGGEHSYDYGDYENSFFETLLPVKIGLGTEIEGDVNVAVLLDISNSMAQGYSKEEGSSTLADFAKAQVINVLQDLRPEDRVALIAYNADPFIIANFGSLEDQYSKLVDKISTLSPGGGTIMHKALQVALDMLEGRAGSNYIVILSDGSDSKVGQARSLIDKAASKGIRVFTVGVGEKVHDTFLEDFAQRGHGAYLEPNSTQNLRIAFGRAPKDKQGNLLDVFAVQAVDDGHFITQFLDLNASIAGYNIVTPKAAARLLVATEMGNPLVTIWRFGLGRVAAFSTDDGEKWAGRLLSAQNSQVISRSINWAIGDLQRKSGYYVDIPDTNIDKPIEIVVKSTTEPESPGLEFAKIEENLYSASYKPESIGFHTILGKKFAVNYPSEYERIGFNQNLNSTIRSAGGQILDLDDVEKLIEIIKTTSKKIKTDFIYYRWPLIAIALLIFLLEVCVRRLTENRR